MPQHVLTADWLGYQQAGKFAWSAYAPHLSWAEPEPKYADAIAAVGIKTIYYTNPNRQAPGGPMYTTDESTFSHDCSGARIIDPATGLYLMNPNSSALADDWKALATHVSGSAHYDAYEEDDSNDVYQLNAMPCYYTPTWWLNHNVTLTKAFSNAGHAVIYNGLSILGPNASISPTIALNQAAAGGMMEGCYVRPGTTNLQPNGAVWQTIENTELQMAAQKKMFFCYADNWQYQMSDPVAINLRYYVYASFLLTYDTASSVLWESFLTPSGFRVSPETKVVATQPIVATPLAISGLLTATGAYGRQYGACFIGGVLVGKCAAVVNSDAFHSHAFPFSGYAHTMVISGSGVLDGGSVSASGPAPPATLAPLGAVVAFQ